MPFTFRRRLTLGPLFVNISKRGVSSWGIKLWRLTWNLKRGTTSIDLPGPVNWRSK